MPCLGISGMNECVMLRSRGIGKKRKKHFSFIVLTATMGRQRVRYNEKARASSKNKGVKRKAKSMTGSDDEK
jgi:hypothetical protein